jgi:hypothetical protein
VGFGARIMGGVTARQATSQSTLAAALLVDGLYF